MSLRKYLAVPFFLLFLTGSFVISAQAQGIIIPRPCDRHPRCPRPLPPPMRLPVSLPVKSITLEVKIKAGVAHTKVEQVFENRTDATLEGIYMFPVPDAASVTGFAVWENGRKLSGEVMARDEARKVYDSIVRSMRDPGLLEYAGKDLLQASVFPILPRSEKKIELEYSEILKRDSGTTAYEYPLGTGRAVLDPRIRGGAEVAPSSFGTVAGTIEIEDGAPVRNVYSPTHKIDVTSRGRGSLVSFESKGDPEDFRLYYSSAKDNVGLSLITFREPGKDGFFMLTASAAEDSSSEEVVEKDVVFVLDTSGSMADDGKLEKARPALRFGIRSLNKGDRFGLVSFAGEERVLETSLKSASADSGREAERFLESLKASGGTNIDAALQRAVSLFDGTARPKFVILLTDGLPTVGERDVSKIIANVRTSGVKGLRLFTFGVGYDVNTRLLDKLGADNSGYSEYVEPKEDLEVKVSGFFRKINFPVLSEVKLDLGRVRVLKNHPDRFSDLFSGLEAVMLGRYENDSDLKDVTIELSGVRNGRSRAYRFGGNAFPLRSSGNDFLPRLWASRRVGWLIEQIRANGESKELRDEIVDLGTRYGLVTPYTSYLAADGSFAARETDGNRFRVDPESPALSAAVREEAGKDAVRRSVQQNALRDNLYVRQADPASGEKVFLAENGKNVFFGGKNFIRDGEAWIDADFDTADGSPLVDVAFGSEAYFALATSEPELARYLALGKNVTVVWNGKVYRIRE